MSIAISDALQQAEQAIQSGDSRSAIQTCNQLVNQFPDYAEAYRVLGEAYLQQGQVSEAEQAFAQALLRDPRQSRAYHGLGLIAEKQNVLENALAFCQVAWELAPNQPQLREPVIRIASHRFGADGQAQLTSAALAQIYANTSRLQRAATEYRGALADLPDRVDLKLGLAQTLWQLGKDDEAADLCRQVLEEYPVAIQALVVLADIEGRAGQESEAADLRARIRAIDPDGRIAAVMLANNTYADRDALLVPEGSIPVLDAAAEPVVAERPHIAPAPDFSYQPARAEQAVQNIEDLEPISAEEFGGEAGYDDDFATQATAELEPVGAVDDAIEPVAAVDDDAPSIFRTDDDLTGDESLAGIEQEMESSEPVEPAASVEETPADDDFDSLLAEFGDVEPMGLDEFGAEPEDLERLAANEQDLLADDDIFAGFDMTQDSGTGENEHVRSLASALESDVAGVLDRTGEFQTVGATAETAPEDSEPEAEMATETESELETAGEEVEYQPEDIAVEDVEQPEDIAVEEPEAPAPDPLSGTGYTTVLRELGDEGLTPFDPMGRPDIQDAQPQASFAEGDDAGHGAEEDELAKLTQDWESIDDEIARAVPVTTGQTDQLRAADDLGIDPFDFEIEDDTSRLPAYRPFGEDDDELPEPELEAETETAAFVETEAPVEQVQEDTVVQDEPEAAEAAYDTLPAQDAEQVTEQPVEDDLFANLEPFSLDEFEEEESGEQKFSFGALPWETQEGGSAVPSDEDLEAMLTAEDQAPSQPEEPAEETVAPAAEPDWPTRVLDTTPPAEEQVDWVTAIQDDQPVETEPEPAAEDETPSTWSIPEDWDSSLAVTRQIGESEDPLAEQIAAAETAAQASDDMPADVEAEEVHEEEPTSVTGLLGGADPEQIAADQDLFERTRSAKTDLISQGTISGDMDFAADEPEPQPEPEPEPVVEEPVYQEQVEEPAAEEDFVVATGSSRDVNTLRASLEAAPNDDELHWWLAEALRERGDITEAYAEYRWIIRNATHRADDVIEALNFCIEDEQHAEVGHRLLADIYRRRGQVSLASSHAATAMAVRRRLRG